MVVCELAKYCDRLLSKFWAPNRDVLTPEMMARTTLSPTECAAAVVTDVRFSDWEAELEGGDYKKAAKISAPDTLFGKRLTRAWLFFRGTRFTDHGDTPLRTGF